MGQRLAWRPSAMLPAREAHRSGAPADPFLATRVDLLLPERDRALERVDRLAARVERGGAVRGGDGDHDAGLPDLDPSYTMVDRDPGEPVLRGQLVAEP